MADKYTIELSREELDTIGEAFLSFVAEWGEDEKVRQVLDTIRRQTGEQDASIRAAYVPPGGKPC